MINTTMLDIINDIIDDAVSGIVIDHIAEDSTRDFYDSPSQVIFNPPATIVIFNDGTKKINSQKKLDSLCVCLKKCMVIQSRIKCSRNLFIQKKGALKKT